jgi:hypothetical protein
MRDFKETEEMVKRHLQGLYPAEDAGPEDRTLADALAAMRNAKPHPEPRGREIGRSLVKHAGARLAAGVAVILLIVGIATRVSRPVWAVEETIAAVQKYGACNLTLLIGPGIVYDFWAKAEPSGELSGDVTLKGSNGSVIWVKDDKTYYYDRGSHTVEVDDAKTAGFQPWLGPELFRLIAKARDAAAAYAKDPSSGRELVVMTGSMLTVAGHISWSVEFDRETKLPVALKEWANPRRSGAPAVTALRITYYQEPPKDAMRVEVPAGAIYRDKPIVLPDGNLERMEDPAQGISAEGMTRADAARKILEQAHQAIIAGDLASIRRLCPLVAPWSDGMVRALLLKEEEQGKRPAEVVEIGGIAREGYDRVGPFVVLPVRVRTRDGKLWDQKHIVQFRLMGGRESCVVYGPYGMTSEVK